MMRLARKWRGFRLELSDRYGRSVRNVARHNTRRGFEKLFAADDLLSEYLGDERLAFYEEVASIAAPYVHGSVVDIGCGSGNLLRAVLDRVVASRGYAVERVLALDYAHSAVSRAADLVPEAEGRTFDIMRDRLDGERFDLVLCTEVLEHMRRPMVARDQLAEACAAGGTILITVPDGALDSWEGHLNFWNEEELRLFLEPVGATTVRRIDSDRGLLAIVSPS
jgi:2-polyprenyl-3-methyl-5-hydroxy-6-metoxy-1,4-benzoquinol methylase